MQGYEKILIVDGHSSDKTIQIAEEGEDNRKIVNDLNKKNKDLERQVQFLRSKYPDDPIIRDIGSGLNWKKIVNQLNIPTQPDL